MFGRNDETNSPMSDTVDADRRRRRVWKARVAAATAVIGGAAGVVSVPSAQAVEGGTAACDALDVALFAEFSGTTIVDISGGSGDVTAPDPDNGTNTSGGTVSAGGGDNVVTADVLNCNATRAPGSLSADADIASGAVVIGGVTVATLGTITSDVLCPAAGTGTPTASASGSVTLDGTVISLDSGGATTGSGTVEFVLAGIADGVITVDAASTAAAGSDSAEATGLALRLSFSGAALGQSVAFDLGTILLAETACTVGAPDPGGTTTTTTPGDTTTTTTPGDGDGDDGDDGDDGNGGDDGDDGDDGDGGDGGDDDGQLPATR